MCAHARRPHWPCVKRGRHLTRGPLSLASCAEPRNVTHKPEAPRAPERLERPDSPSRARALAPPRAYGERPFPSFPSLALAVLALTMSSSTTSASIRLCTVCDKPGDQQCSACRAIFFCSTRCQKLVRPPHNQAHQRGTTVLILEHLQLGPTHKALCGRDSEAFFFPPLSPADVEALERIKDKPFGAHDPPVTFAQYLMRIAPVCFGRWEVHRVPFAIGAGTGWPRQLWLDRSAAGHTCRVEQLTVG